MATKKKLEPAAQPLFKCGDVVKLIGVQGPDMLVSEEPEVNGDGKYSVTCTHFGGSDFNEHYFTENLLQLVKPASRVLEEAEAATKEVRNRY